MISKKIVKLKYVALKLPSLWSYERYYPLAYRKSINEVKGYYLTTWSQLKSILPLDYELNWFIGKQVQFKIKIDKGEQTYFNSSIVGFKELNQTNNRALRKNYARYNIDYVKNGLSLQLQMLFVNTENISTNLITKMRIDFKALLESYEFNSYQHFFSEYLNGLERSFTTSLKAKSTKYDIKMVKIVKCKII